MESSLYIWYIRSAIKGHPKMVEAAKSF